MIVSGGVNVYPKDIEDVAIEHPDVNEAAVFGVPDERWGETPLVAVVLCNGASVDARELMDWINARVGAKFQRVKEVTILEEFPRNVAGKILKRDLRKPFWDPR
jgi:acyl-CoA synthetase (AMP-forming)/AMP-acid ligase II